MSSSVKEERERENTSIKDSRAMTIKFLRARLLSERSISKAATQRAEELSNKVLELEEQLKFTSLQRKKAEKAMTDVLAVLENHGISDMSGGFDSNSDQDGILHEFKIDSLMSRDASDKIKATKNEMEAYYGSEIESSPSTGRSLSWKSSKESQYSLEKKKNMDSIRRRTSFALNVSSARRTGKSYRRIRGRNTRAIEEFQNDGHVKATFLKDVSNRSHGEPDTLRDVNHDGGEKPADNPMLESDNGSQKINDRCITIHGREKDIERALQHQAQFIGLYEEEEKAQREWEEKFREKNSCEQDSGDPGNCSDVTEERGEIKLPEVVSDGAGTLSLNNQEIKGKSLGTIFSEEPHAIKSLPSLSDAKEGFLQDSSKSAESEFLIPVSNRNNDQEISRSHHHDNSSNMAYPSSKVSSSHTEKSTPLFISPSSSSSVDLTVVPRETTSSNLGSVLEALQQAKSSLHEKLNSLSLVDRETSNMRDTSFKTPTGSHALLQLPTEDQYKANTVANQHNIGESSSFSSFPHEVSGGKFITRPYVIPKMALSNDTLLTVPSSTSTVPPQISSLSQPRLGGTVPPAYNQTNHIDSYTNMVLPSVKDTYPFFTLRSPLKEGTLRPSASLETGLPYLPSYNEGYRSYMNS